MKNLLKGFTLAEILVTLSVVGVIASMTLPSLSANVQKQQVGPALAKAINTLESANQMVLQNSGARTLDRAIPNGAAANNSAYFSQILSQCVPFTPTTLSKPYYNFRSSTNANYSGYTGYTTKDNMTFWVTARLPQNSNVRQEINLNPNYGGQYYPVWVDINGHSKGPNMMGKDLFSLIVDTKGSVMAYGSDAFRAYSSLQQMDWRTKCPNTSPVTCAGSIVDNGYKVVYDF